MPIRTTTLVQHKVILIKPIGNIVINEYVDLNKIINDLLAQGTFPVHVIVELTHSGYMPTDVQQVIKVLTWLGHENLGWTLFCGLRAEHKFLTAILIQANKNRYREFNTLQDTLTFLEDMDDSLRGQLLED